MNEITTLAGYRINNKSNVNHWQPLIDKWLFATEKYCEIMEGDDAPFIYTERASIGILSSAAWLCGWVALEEFQHKKGFRNAPKSLGRADLYIASNKSAEMIEAKQKWVCLSVKEEQQLDRANIVLSEAMRDAKKTQGGTSIDCVAVAFLGMWLNNRQANVPDLDETINRTIEVFTKSTLPVVAWSFPSKVRDLENMNGELLPGVILIASR